MCELLGMSANVPTDICFSFSGLMKRGGDTGPHKDGWGIVFYNGKGYREFRDINPSAQSEVAQLVKKYPIKSDIVISHIRRANSGRLALENTHPFIRELWGRHWTFAHNGQLKSVKKHDLEFYRPVGTTDSEHAFCWIMDNIRRSFTKPPSNPRSLFRPIFESCQALQPLGVFNMLMSDSRYLYVYCGSQLSWITRRAPFGEAHLRDEDVRIDFCQETTGKDIVTVIATQALTDNEEWHTMKPGEYIVFKDGIPVANYS